MTWWQSIDLTLFQWINSDLGNPFFDAVLPLFREKWFWAPFYLFIVSFIWQNFSRKKSLLLLLGLVFSVALADFTSSNLLKKNVQRIRPCNDPLLEHVVQLRVSCGSGYSFTSSHAANHFAVAVYLCLVFSFLGPWWCTGLLIWAFVVAISQVYVGVHYPGDVLGGGVLGVAIGWWTGYTVRRWIALPRGKKTS